MRERGDEFEYFEEDSDFQEGVRRTFLDLSKNHHLPESLKTKWLVINGSQDKGVISDHIIDAVLSL